VRVVFMGTPDYAVPTLDALVAAGHELVCVVAQPDKPQGRGQQLQAPPVARRALELGLPLRQPRALRSGPFPAWMIDEARADVAVVVAYGRILPPALLAAPRLGCLNGHASLLPRHRGAAPIQRAIMAGDRQTGVCVMQMDAGLDTGPVLLRRAIDIGPDEPGPALWDRLSQLTAALMVEALDRLPELVPEPQDEALATLAPPLTRDDGVVDWAWPARRVHDRVRGADPWPGGQTRLRGEPWKLHRTAVLDDEGSFGLPGQVLEAGPRLVVAAGQGRVELLEVQLPGKPRRPARDVINGLRLRPGEQFGA
jgi:methionyl-tRNA formyltransferase